MNANEQTKFSIYSTFCADTDGTGTDSWQWRHDQAVLAPQGPEAAIVNLIDALCRAAGEFNCFYGFQEVVVPMIRAARTALNFESGRLDCGTLDKGLMTVLTTRGEEMGLTLEQVEELL